MASGLQDTLRQQVFALFRPLLEAIATTADAGEAEGPQAAEVNVRFNDIEPLKHSISVLTDEKAACASWSVCLQTAAFLKWADAAQAVIAAQWVTDRISTAEELVATYQVYSKGGDGVDAAAARINTVASIIAACDDWQRQPQEQPAAFQWWCAAAGASGDALRESVQQAMAKQIQQCSEAARPLDGAVVAVQAEFDMLLGFEEVEHRPFLSCYLSPEERDLLQDLMHPPTCCSVALQPMRAHAVAVGVATVASWPTEAACCMQR